MPNIDTTTCKVKVAAYDSGKKELSSDASNSNFTIEKSNILIFDFLPLKPLEIQKKP